MAMSYFNKKNHALHYTLKHSSFKQMTRFKGKDKAKQ